jgi:hypothetical protein
MENKKFLLLSGLGLALAASFAYGVFGPSLKKTPAAAVQAAALGFPDTLDGLTVPERQASRTAYKTWGKNPMVAREAVSGPAVSGFALSGILWDKTKPTAIVNDEIVTRGSRLGDFVVVEIRKDRVVLDDGQNRVDLRLE